MPYIHELPDWPNFQWNTELLANRLANTRHRQGLLLGKMSSLGFAARAEAGLETLTEDIVKSGAIEGEHLDSAQVRSSLARRLGIDIGGLAPANRNVEGVVEMMLDATRQYSQALTRERLFGWHAALFPTGYSNARRIAVAAWRAADAGAMQVVSGPIGHERVHFEAPRAERLEHEMSVFLNWFAENENLDPVIKAGVAHLWFVSIHPFEDGNGRIARAIADMQLARADNSAERFFSMSAQIERERKAYYDILEHSQKGGINITAWLDWFLLCLAHAVDGADSMLSAVMRKAKVWNHANNYALNERQRLIVNKLLGDFYGKLTSGKYAKLAKCSQDTAIRDIKSLIEYGILRQGDGAGRSTNYELADNAS
ncbi:MAG: Fic family protein [Deltaproteobacteria bacterium]|jgi:Fic family protein|nr:Fic family protein [Deltaproteobacteria bacterium]